jgi:anti-sigma B factor antagonist
MNRAVFSSMREHFMNINARIVGDIHFLDCRGKLTVDKEAMAVRTIVGDILKEGGKKIVLNLADVADMDNSGVGDLVSTYSDISKHGGQLKILNPTKRIRELLTTMRLLTIFQVDESESATVAGFV